MTAPTREVGPDPVLCPACREPLVGDAAYCGRCGVQVRHPCPACGGAARPLSTMPGAPEPWCTECGSLLQACEQCGRWLLPGADLCPDPQCAGTVSPVLPQHTGRRWDLAGRGSGWVWPAKWESANPDRIPPERAAWAAGSEVRAAFVAHGRLYAWEGANLVAPAPVQPSAAAAADGASYRAPLGPAARPAPRLAASERCAVVGGGVVLAMERRFALAGLRAGEVAPLEAGEPITQVGGRAWWVAWTREGGSPVLRLARAGDTWDALAPEPVPVPEGAEPAEDARLALIGGRACWPGADGALWGLECASRRVDRILAPAEGYLMVWAGDDGPRWAREARGEIVVGLSRPVGERVAVTAPAGAGPLHGVYAAGDRVFVVGDRVSVFDSRTGDRLTEAARPAGRWIEGAAVPAPDGEPRLLALTRQDSYASLTALRASTGAEDPLWHDGGAQPIALLPVGRALYVVSRSGIVRLAERA